MFVQRGIFSWAGSSCLFEQHTDSYPPHSLFFFFWLAAGHIILQQMIRSWRDCWDHNSSL